MRYEECVHILREFRPHGLPKGGNEIATRVAVRTIQGKERARLEVLVRNPAGPTGWVPPVFKYKFKGQLERIETAVKAADAPVALSGGGGSLEQHRAKGVCGGDTALGSGKTTGTAGWFLYLDKRLMCISNWHVLGPSRGNITVESKARAASATGVVDWTAPVQCNAYTVNGWDVALAEMTPADVAAEMEDTTVAFPTKISEYVTVGDGEQYATLGDGHAGWTYGTLGAVWSGWVGFGYDWAYFANQLQFDPMTQSGDSGSVVIRLSDNSVTGLVFSGDPTMTLANPISYLGWTWVGTNDGIGCFEST